MSTTQTIEAHSPLPWHAEPLDGVMAVYGADTTRHYAALTDGETQEQTEANAALIVEAVNSHARLLTDREKLRKALEEAHSLLSMSRHQG